MPKRTQHRANGPKLRKNRAHKDPVPESELGEGLLKNPLRQPQIVNRAKRVLMARTGMSPLDFLVAVYRNELYDDYERWLAEDGKTYFYVPKREARRIPLALEQRVQAARAAAPYLHKKMPIGIEDTRTTNSAVIPAEKLAELSDAELDTLLKVLGKVGVGVQPFASDVPKSVHGIVSSEAASE